MKTENELKNTATADEFAEYLGNEKKLNREPLNAEYRLTAKSTALRMAREINPTNKTSTSQKSLGYNLIDVPPTIEKLLKDAQTIYDWLTA